MSGEPYTARVPLNMPTSTATFIPMDSHGHVISVPPTPDLSPLKVQDEFWHYATRCVICGRLEIDPSGKITKFPTDKDPGGYMRFLDSCREGLVGFAPCPTCEVMTIHELVAASMDAS